MASKELATKLDNDLILAVIQAGSAGSRNREGCRVGAILDKMRERKPQVFETFQHLLQRPDAQHKAIAKAMNDVAKSLAEETEVPLSVNGAIVARHRGDVSNPCKCGEVYEWMTNS